MLNAVKFGHEGFVPVIKMIEELAKECRKSEWTVEKKDLSDVKKKLADTFTEDLKKAFATRDKHCLLYTSPSPRDGLLSRMPSSA